LQLSLLALLFASPALAQQGPEWEFFGGYSFERSVVREYFKSTPTIYTFRERYENLNGWEASITENINRWFGGTFQATGHYKTPVASGVTNHVRSHSFMYGPRFSHRTRWATPYLHILVGVTNASVTVSPGPHASETGFTMGLGGGLDLNLGKNFSVRALQVQYSPMNPIVSKENKFQASAGVVFYAGKTK
jgi:opacity protein-like surface antigen